MHRIPPRTTRLACALGLAFAAVPALAAPNCAENTNYDDAIDCVIPAGKTSVTIRAWGGGGGGAAGVPTISGGGGGGGGAYCEATFTVAAGGTLVLNPGESGQGSVIAYSGGGFGGNTTIVYQGDTLLNVGGGGGGTSAGGIGGTACSAMSPDKTVHAGGSGAGPAGNGSGGGGGGSAKSDADGGNANGAGGGSGASGNGGNGAIGSVLTPSGNGANPGSGGGGGSAHQSLSTLNAGSSGGKGRITLSFPQIVPGLPNAVTTDPGDGAVRVSWTAPGSDGGSPITGYKAFARDGGNNDAGECTAGPAETSCVISGLTNGQSYYFDARAENANGFSDPQWMTTATVPAKLEPTGLTVPGTSGGPATVVIGGNPPGCGITGTPEFSDTNIPDGAPANADFPVGAFRFAASGCAGSTLTVSITYPQPLAPNVQLMKYGPKTATVNPIPPAPSEWFGAPGAAISQNRKTVTYTVRDNGPGDSNPAEGVITDPFAPMLLPPPATHAVTATASPSAGGTVQCTPNPVTEGDTATCTASANTGYTFAAWTGACAGQGATCSLPNVTAPQASVAQFTPQAPAQPASIPTLGEWGLLLLSALAAAFGLRTVRRRA